MATVSATRSPAQLFALVFGVVYLFFGIIGFAVTGFDDFAAESFAEKVLLFPVNPLHNIVHLAIGALWIGAARSHTTAKTVNMLIGVVYLIVGIVGLLGVLKFLAIENAVSADNYLHLATGALGVYFGSVGAGAAAGKPRV